MKKIFLFAAAAVAAMTINAKVIDFANVASESDYTISAAGVTKNSGSTDAKIMYDLAKENALEVVFPSFGVSFSQKAQTSDKSKYFTVAFGDYVEVGGKGFVLTVEELKAGDKIKFLVANKSDKGEGTFSAVENLSGADVALPKKGATTGDENGYTWVAAEFTATAAGDVKVSEIMYGFRIKAIAINEELPQGIDEIEAAPKAEKFFENGQLVIIKNGVKYNALGAQL